MRCACDSVTVLNGRESEDYAVEHLEKVSVDAAAWTKNFRCPATGAEWFMDYPESELPGGGSPRLRRLDESGQALDGPSSDPFR